VDGRARKNRLDAFVARGIVQILSDVQSRLLADSIRQKGLRDEYKIAGKGTPLVVYAKNPETTPEEKHYPASGIALGITVVKTRLDLTDSV
jgi:hypothetical protein